MVADSKYLAILSVFAQIIANMKYIYKNKKRSITQIICVRIAQNVADMMPGWVSCNLSK